MRLPSLAAREKARPEVNITVMRVTAMINVITICVTISFTSIITISITMIITIITIIISSSSSINAA